MVAAAGAPCGILAVYALVTEQLGGEQSAALVTGVVCVLLIYCPLVYWLGYAKFKRLEVVDAPSRELGLPAGLEAFFVRPLTRVSARFRGPFATLLKKEFRLQQVSFLLAGLFVLIAAAGFCLIKGHSEVASGIVGGDFFLYVLILPLIAGAVSVAEERGWGMAEWHLTLPPSALKQWSAKMLATLSTSLVLGLLLPTALVVAGQWLLGQLVPRSSLPPLSTILSWVLTQLLVTSVAVYAASFARNTFQAILAAFVVLMAGVGIVWLAGTGTHVVGFPPFQWVGHPYVLAAQILPLLPAALLLMLCVIHWFACPISAVMGRRSPGWQASSPSYFSPAG